MRHITTINVIVFALAISFAVLAYNFFTFQKEQKAINAKTEKAQLDLGTTISAVDSNMKIANTNSLALAKSILYLDSCQQQRVFKQDRAERRGRFVGGLLKGLFPHL